MLFNLVLRGYLFHDKRLAQKLPQLSSIVQGLKQVLQHVPDPDLQHALGANINSFCMSLVDKLI